ncbi:uncharacterized protein LOC118462677 [Anopheles albimanus]|uniref:Gustatory receptor n=1 Tax=Anopheles albimanus TaxID=7167 RepID=A0A182FFT1_ANOAL|nr:uncharacterized protein LOC118462677 [Anopheles albimanus]
MFRFRVKHYPFFNGLLYNLEILLALTNTLLITVGSRRFACMYDQVLQHFIEILQKSGNHVLGLDWISVWFNRMLIVSIGTFLLAIAIDWLSWQNVCMTLASICCVHLPTLVTAFTVGQYWFAVTFVLHACRRINGRMIDASLGKRCESANRVRLLESFRKQHSMFHELMIYINGGYGKVLLSITATIIVVVNVELLELYQYLRQGVGSVSNGSHVVYAVIWLLIHIGLLLLIVYPNHSMDHERRRTGLLLYEHFGASNKEENEALIRFSKQILHQREEYRACDIVPLNLSIIATLIGALSTGLAILIQFASN